MSTDKTAATKMHMKPGFTIHVINKPDDYEDLLGGIPERAQLVDEPADNVDFVHLFVLSRLELLEQLPATLKNAPNGAAVWISYPKKTSGRSHDINRDVVIAEVLQFGWRSVSNISLNDNWSAVRLRPQ